MWYISSWYLLKEQSSRAQEIYRICTLLHQLPDPSDQEASKRRCSSVAHTWKQGRTDGGGDDHILQAQGESLLTRWQPADWKLTWVIKKLVTEFRQQKEMCKRCIRRSKLCRGSKKLLSDLAGVSLKKPRPTWCWIWQMMWIEKQVYFNLLHFKKEKCKVLTLVSDSPGHYTLRGDQLESNSPEKNHGKQQTACEPAEHPSVTKEARSLLGCIRKWLAADLGSRWFLSSAQHWWGHTWVPGLVLGSSNTRETWTYCSDFSEGL